MFKSFTSYEDAPLLRKRCCIVWSIGPLCLGGKGEKCVVKVPSGKGFVLENVGLRWSLFAFRVSFVRVYVCLLYTFKGNHRGIGIKWNVIDQRQ